MIELESYRGFYNTSFFHIYINGEFKDDLEKMSTKDQGTFVHEYIHYIQNISTVYGLRYSDFFHSYILWSERYIKEHESINLPFCEKPQQNGYTIGDEIFSHSIGTRSSEIKRSQISYIDFQDSIIKTSSGKHIHKMILHLYSNEKAKLGEIEFGSLCVKENMAYLYQTFFDKELENDNIVYNCVELICKQVYPEIVYDKRKLICLCAISLFSQTPGLHFFKALNEAKANPKLNGLQLYKFLLKKWMIKQNENLKEYFLYSLSSFKSKLKDSVGEIDYYGPVLDLIYKKAEQNDYPYLEILYKESPLNMSDIQELISIYGIPYIEDNNKGKGPINDGEQFISKDILVLISIEAVIKKILYPDKITCTLSKLCSWSEPPLDDIYCDTTPWKRDEICPFKIISDAWKLSEKIVK